MVEAESIGDDGDGGVALGRVTNASRNLQLGVEGDGQATRRDRGSSWKENGGRGKLRGEI